MLLNHQGTTILTDPQFSNRASPFSFIGPKRVTPVPFGIEDLPDIDLVIISHNQYDHLDSTALLRWCELQPDISFSALSVWLNRCVGGVQKRSLSWIGGCSLPAMPALISSQHLSSIGQSARYLIENQMPKPAGCCAGRIFHSRFCRDTGYSDDFSQIARRLGNLDLGGDTYRRLCSTRLYEISSSKSRRSRSGL